MKIIKVIFNFIYWIIIFCLVVIAGVTAFSNLQLPNNGGLLVVQSGSMEPSVKTGSLIVIKKQDTYSLGDIITFAEKGKDSTTHRVTKNNIVNGKEIFSTKGDANQAGDRETISVDSVLGKTIFTFPYLGYVVAFTKTQRGFIFLIVVPAVIIISSEILNIKKEVLQFINRKRKETLLASEKKQWRYSTHD